MMVCSALVAVSSMPVAVADPDECRDAIDHYKSTIDDVAAALRRYSNCLGDSRGRDDCSIEFSSLRSEQDDFESAVSRYKHECT